MWFADWISRDGNEWHVRLTLHKKRWYLPIGVDVRKGWLSVGFLCFSGVVSWFHGLSPYTKSIGRG
jgi:hypothetical protein